MYEPIKTIESEIGKMELQLERLKQNTGLEATERLTRIGNITKGIDARRKILNDVKFTALVLEANYKFIRELVDVIGSGDGRLSPKHYLRMKKMKQSLQDEYSTFNLNE